MAARRSVWFRVVPHAAAWILLALLMGLFWLGRLGPDPIGELTRRTGRYALIFLLASLVPTVIKTVFGYGGLLSWRRALGLYALLFAVVHLLTFLGLDYTFDFSQILPVLREGRREIVGLAALGLLALLGVTSTRGWMSRLGENWKRLHRLTYLASALVVLHYVWNYKELRIAPLLAGGVLLLLLLARIPPMARLLARWRDRKWSLRSLLRRRQGSSGP